MLRHVRYRLHPGTGSSKTLVVALHGCTKLPRSRAGQLRHVIEAVHGAWPEANVLTPIVPIEFWSLQDPNHIVTELLRMIDREWTRQAEVGSPYTKVVLIGFSFGSQITRQLYCRAAGALRNGTVGTRRLRPWVASVDRIVLLAGLNRGWTVDSPVSRLAALFNHVGTTFAELLPWKKPTLLAIRRGAPFLTQTRLQWLALGAAGRLPLTVQLLGTRDDIVSPVDNIDLATGKDFLYLEVPQSGHFDVVQMTDDPVGRERRSRFITALTASPESLRAIAVTGSDLLQMLPIGTDLASELSARAQSKQAVDHVVFVVHGIRDKGYWTPKVARLMSETGQRKGLTVVAVAPTYGYFPLLPFLFRWLRQEKVKWLLDLYVAVRSHYPDACVSFVGHSNGTYILAGAIEACRAVRFHNVVFAGSVVKSTFDWRRHLARKQVTRVLNYVATADWVVAIFPRLLQKLWRDVGGAGHDGFNQEPLPISDVEYVPGRHNAAIGEHHWQNIADFILDGPPPVKEESTQHRLVVWAGRLAPLVWALLIAVAVIPLYLLLVALGAWVPEGTWIAAWQQKALATSGWKFAGALFVWLRFLQLVLTKL